METINNMANAATKAIWGTNGANEEPVSGVKGNTNQGEPYDAGNIEDPLAKEKKADIASSQASTPATGATTTTEPTTTTTGLNTTTTPSTATASSGLKVTEDASKQKENIGKPELKHESPKDAPPADSAAGKTDIRHPADPATDAAAKGQDVDNTASGPTSGGDKLDGPGPRPLETVAKERGGDAGKVTKDSSQGGLVKGDSTSGLDEKEEDGPQKVSHGEGTGEQYVKTSGLAADGGDFDATKPGAGREADRLLDEKDPAHAAAKAAVAAKPGNNASEGRTHSPAEGTEKEKKSLGDKIKAKLHRH